MAKNNYNTAAIGRTPRDPWAKPLASLRSEKDPWKEPVPKPLTLIGRIQSWIRRATR